MDGSVLVSRSAGAGDVPAILRLVHAAYRGGPQQAGWTTEAHLLDGLRADAPMILGMINHSDGQILLFEADGELIACCQVEWHGGEPGDDGPPTGYFGLFAVRPDRQGGGIGKVVLAEAERLAANQGCRQMRMTVLSVRDDLIAFYERRGYRRTGRATPFPYGDERFGVPKRPDLEFAELVKRLTPAAPGH
jgi:GNAT superfamily N-acetyltransferase